MIPFLNRDDGENHRRNNSEEVTGSVSVCVFGAGDRVQGVFAVEAD